MAFALPMIVLAPIAGVLVSRLGTKPLTILGCVIGAAGFGLATQTTSLDALLLVMAVIGAGLAVMNAAVINLLVLTVEPRDMGLVTSMNAVFRNVGSSIGAPLAGSLLTTFTVVVYGVTFPSPTAFHDAYWIAAGAFLVAAVGTLFAREVLGRYAHKEVLASDERAYAAAVKDEPTPIPSGALPVESAGPDGTR